MLDPLAQDYKGFSLARAALDFAPSEKLERARRTFLVFLVIVLFLEFADVRIEAATLGVVSAKLGRPWVVVAGAWCLYLYSFIVYFLAGRRELAVFTYRSRSPDGFFAQCNRHAFTLQLNEVSGLPHLQPGSGSQVASEPGHTCIRWDVSFLPPDVLARIPGFDVETGIFTYRHEREDQAHFDSAIRLIRPAFNFNYFTYVLPMHVGAGLVSIALVDQLYR